MLPFIDITPDPIQPTGHDMQYSNPGEYGCLAALANSIGAKRVLEIGINYGRTAAMLLKNVPTIEKYIGIDVPPSTPLSLAVQKNEVPMIAGQFVEGDPRVRTIIRDGGSFSVTPEEVGEVDFAFIDGDHSEDGVVQDTVLAMSVVRDGGIIAWHDYHHLGTVDVAQVLEGLHGAGRPIFHVKGTWIAMQTVKK